MSNLVDDFPILQRTVHGKRLVYLDNAATSQKPRVVLDALRSYYEHINANIHRGIHTLAEEATRQYEKTRDDVAQFFGAGSREEIIFTKNATEALNLVAFAYGRTFLRPGDDIIVSITEHHSNFVPWQQLARETGAVLKVIDIDGEGRLCIEDTRDKTQETRHKRQDTRDKGDVEVGSLDSLITDRTRLIALSHASNVLGTIHDIAAVAAIARPRGIIVVVDGAQAAPHIPVEVEKLGIDFYACSSHKMLGPLGVGILYGRRGILEKCPPFLTGGDMIKRVTLGKTEWNDAPWKFEAGTPDIAGVIAFGAAVGYLHKVGWEIITSHEQTLGEYALHRLTQTPELTLYGPHTMENRLGLFSFNLRGIHAHDLATILDDEGIAIRSGSHCAHPLMARLGISAAARASLYLYNTKEDVDVLMTGLQKARQMFSS
ncbi:MAG: cysteine desulfurase [Patescibacteria group bacterium]